MNLYELDKKVQRDILLQPKKMTMVVLSSALTLLQNSKAEDYQIANMLSQCAGLLQLLSVSINTNNKEILDLKK